MRLFQKREYLQFEFALSLIQHFQNSFQKYLIETSRQGVPNINQDTGTGGFSGRQKTHDPVGKPAEKSYDPVRKPAEKKS